MNRLLSNSFANFWYETKPPTSVIKYMNKLAESILLSIVFFISGRFLTIWNNDTDIAITSGLE